MHDPQTVAFEIRRPWPQIRKAYKPKPFKIGFTAFWYIGKQEWYWPGLITIWHVDPSGYDSNEDCPYSGHWQWHVHHWKLQIHPLQHLRRWALTRCEWCHGRSHKGDLVNHSLQWDNEKSPWWKGERGLFHSDCSSIASAHRQCACELHEGGPWESGLSGDPYGRCATCGKYRGWQGPDRKTSPRDEANRLLQTIPAGKRDPATLDAVSKLWRDYRKEQ
ncbi:hypothetical protein HOU49_gp60 [Arthrobacter phage Eileen]|uniref:Uncharacterized protein n=1 Tax=Arthrobacter phage Eileen TaxID=2419956 RepID=A0A3G2KFW1_9CAUD|nr:hypothetical protein HOU49_gp60 [Arthrobacter phage Eileen]AYN57847.1 hypothetical protein PBI_EILEEN_60 [Arthrobacter phage Eileen]